MKVKRKIGAIVCCLAVMTGMFSVSVLPAKAAMCTHPIYSVGEERYGTSVAADGHYEIHGLRHVCPACGYFYWTDLHNVKIEGHTWVTAEKDGALTFYCSGCNHFISDFR